MLMQTKDKNDEHVRETREKISHQASLKKYYWNTMTFRKTKMQLYTINC